jgi:hypothetical protein
MRFKGIVCILALAACHNSVAQQLDPRVPLGQLIQAFQNCMPSPAYGMMGPQLYQVVWAQTGGSGCYPMIRNAGPVQNMQIIDQRQLPNGWVYAIRVVHLNGGAVDWFIGINKFTRKVDYLNYQTAQATLPSVSTGVVNGGQIVPPAGGSMPPNSGGTMPAGGDGGNSTPAPAPPAKKRDECDMFPAMC